MMSYMQQTCAVSAGLNKLSGGRCKRRLRGIIIIMIVQSLVVLT